jgi:hypothetical protein
VCLGFRLGLGVRILPRCCILIGVVGLGTMIVTTAWMVGLRLMVVTTTRMGLLVVTSARMVFRRCW